MCITCTDMYWAALTYICTVTLYSILHGSTVHQMVVTAGLLFISAVLKFVWWQRDIDVRSYVHVYAVKTSWTSLPFVSLWEFRFKSTSIMYYVFCMPSELCTACYCTHLDQLHSVLVHMQVIPSNRPTADKLLIHDFFSSWLQTSYCYWTTFLCNTYSMYTYVCWYYVESLAWVACMHPMIEIICMKTSS